MCGDPRKILHSYSSGYSFTCIIPLEESGGSLIQHQCSESVVARFASGWSPFCYKAVILGQ